MSAVRSLWLAFKPLELLHCIEIKYNLFPPFKNFLSELLST